MPVTEPGPRPMNVGLTGGIGSGKSVVGAMFVERGATLIDADAISRELTLPGGAAIEPVRAAFGDAFIGPDGAMDRHRMRSLVFTDPQAKTRLEAILHPLIRAETSRRASAASSPMVVFDIPLLAESRASHRQLDRIVVVDCEVETQIARVMARSGWTREAVERVIAQQATREQRLALADVVIRNGAGTTLGALEAQVDACHRSLSAGRA